MADLPRQRGRIALYGATGYTGRLVAAELLATGSDFVACGRDRAKLEALAEDLGRQVAVQSTALDDSRGLRSAFADCSAVIDCAGPFLRYGEPVVRAAIDAGAHYLDTTGEQRYMRIVLDRYGPIARRAGVALVPAMGFDFAPGDMIASLTAAGMGRLDEVALRYAVSGFGATHGTILSTLEILRGGDVEFRDREWHPARQRVGRGSYEFPAPWGKRRMIRYPAGEQVTVPRHVPTASVHTSLTASTVAPHRRLARTVPLAYRPFGLAMRTPLRRALAAAVRGLPRGPEERHRRAARFLIACEARRGEVIRRGFVSGSDVYGFTAAAVTRGARIAVGRGFKAVGGLAPAQAFDAEDFLDALERFDLAWEVEPLPRREPAAA